MLRTLELVSNYGGRDPFTFGERVAGFANKVIYLTLVHAPAAPQTDVSGKPTFISP